MFSLLIDAVIEFFFNVKSAAKLIIILLRAKFKQIYFEGCFDNFYNFIVNIVFFVVQTRFDITNIKKMLILNFDRFDIITAIIL
jgi:hypothetical protein